MRLLESDDVNKLAFGSSPALSIVVNQFASDDFQTTLFERLSLNNLVLSLTLIDNKTGSYKGVKQSVRETLQREVDMTLQLIRDILLTPPETADTLRFNGRAIARNLQMLSYRIRGRYWRFGFNSVIVSSYNRYCGAWL